MQKILIVEDDIDIQDILKNHLIDAGYEVAVASDGVAGIAMFDDTIDLLLLDIMLPKIDGYGVCEVIRKRSQVPIIMLTALSDEENQLRGFEQQIDDYIPKPFSPKILLCKIAAILRRRTVENQNQSLLTYKELSMDVDGFHVYQGGNEVVLTSKEFALLRLMLENQGKVFTRQMLLDRLWADDLEVEDRIVDSHIKNIRKKLNADYIKTIRGVTVLMGLGAVSPLHGVTEAHALNAPVANSAQQKTVVSTTDDSDGVMSYKDKESGKTFAMKAMREDLKAVERLRKTAEQLSRQERDKSHDRGSDR